ncbi:MAG TPA: DUF4194 domain-containing protein [Leptospiraceae bacterium]|nr:DUF4194 domain-containing protein [Leptospiraceae bacterium]HMW05733.1 DUF4194 domain-containing protein [Leptospiraceae bacterium]HMX32500.1 DUF4194 domain-containing protein [Leptospiraceae bacterium]HMY30234.1 DUF4194 domain-containing protein [Leptospiraceae bacterium]HMZ67588.1 DUF4194 domain-containing protein [Leptospiraceae bacterium]
MEHTLPYAAAVLKLLKGPVNYDLDPKEWDQLATYQTDIKKYFDKIGLHLVVDNDDGFAYLYQPSGDDDLGLPRITRRIPLPFDITLLLVLLREKLTEQAIDDRNLANLLKKEDLYELLNPFYPKTQNESLQYREYDRIISKVVELGFLRKTEKDKNEFYQIEKIIKVRIRAEELNTIKARLLEDNDRKTVQDD